MWPRLGSTDWIACIPVTMRVNFTCIFLEDQSVFISFTHFRLEPDAFCEYDYLDFRLKEMDILDNFTWTKCRQEDIPSRVYRSSIHLFFHTDDLAQFTGFRMMYAILPRSQEPQQLSDNLYNCSVPHFHSFKPLLSCSLVREYQGNEDEKDCGYFSNGCGDGAVDAGTKFYRFVRRGVTTTWADAYNEFSENNQYLIMLATQDEVRRFRHIVASLRNPRSVDLGRERDVQILVAMGRWQNSSYHRHAYLGFSSQMCWI